MPLLTLAQAAPRLGLTERALRERLVRKTIDLEVIPLGNTKHPSLRLREADVAAMERGEPAAS